MATLNVKNFPDDLYRALRRRARERGGPFAMLLREQAGQEVQVKEAGPGGFPRKE